MGRSINARVNDIPVKQKIILLFIVGIVIPTLFLLTLFMFQIQAEFQEREELEIRSEITNAQLSVTATIDIVRQLGAIYFADQQLSWALETYSEGSRDSLSIIRDIDNQVLSHMAVHPYIKAIHIYYENSNLFPTEYSERITDALRKSNWFSAFVEEDSNVVLGYSKDDDEARMYLIRKLNVLRYESQNLIKMDISTDWISETLRSLVANDKQKVVLLLSPQEDIVAANTDLEGIEEYYSAARLSSEYEFYEQGFSSETLMAGWRLVMICPEDEHYAGLWEKWIGIVLSFSLVLVLSMLLFYGLAHTIIQRLERLAKAMDQNKEQDLRKVPGHMGKDEIGFTTVSYNRMVDRLQELMDANAKGNRELIESNRALLSTIETVRKQNDQIHDLVYKDKLTGLLNRYGITTFMDRIIGDRKATQPFAVGFVDLDNFKVINDTYGHDVGDEILKQVAGRMRVFENDNLHIGRFGGDEFIIVRQNFQQKEELEKDFEAIRTSLKEPVIVNKITFALTISMGVSIYEEHSRSRHELITLADIALYKAKDNGRDRIVFFENSMHQLLVIKTQQQDLIRKAIREERFVMYYQPCIDLAKGEIVGYEALLRWQKGFELGMNPQEVVNHIEEMGLMIDFGKWIIQQAFRFARDLNKNRSSIQVVSVNISALQLMDHHFVDDVLNIMKDVEVLPEYVALEMTESILMRSVEHGSEVLQQIRETGIQIYLDDFGTGYSSLSYFKHLPIAALKIDKSFVNHIYENQYDAQLVETIIHLAHNKEVKVIAEGIETEDQRMKLDQMKCDIVQGFLFGRAVSEEEIFSL